ncbi:MAG: hypothetical protein IKV29_03265 [Alistipes sp.]|nr:hypothetical protein [Alistipes sp.]
MKKFFTFAVMFAAVAMVACGGQQKPATEEVAPEAEATVEVVEEVAPEATEEATEEVAPEAEAEVAPEATETVAE